METAFDIDLSGDDLPPGIEAGSLGGDDGTDDPEGPTVVQGSLAGDDVVDDEVVEAQSVEREIEQPVETPPMPEPEPEPTPEAEVPPENPAPKKKRAAPKKKAAAPKAKKKAAAGTVNRLYYIFEIVDAEIDGQIVRVPIRRQFDMGDGIVEGVVDRNRDLAIARAAKMFGMGWRGELVAVPSNYWNPKPVHNAPKDEFRTVVG